MKEKNGMAGRPLVNSFKLRAQEIILNAGYKIRLSLLFSQKQQPM